MSEDNVKNLEELEKQILNDAKVYIFNVMDFGSEYSEEKYQEKLEESHKEIRADGSKTFNTFEPSMMQANLTTLMQGYTNFGVPFINSVIDKDPESAKVMLESVTQDWLDLQNFIREMSDKMENAIKQNQEMIDEENKKGN